MEQPAINILNENRIMTIATVRPDGWPQATVVGYANEGFRIYFLIFRAGQKFANIAQEGRIAISIAPEPSEISEAKAVYAGCRAHEVFDLKERHRAWKLLEERHPNLAAFAEPEHADVATMVADCEHLSVLDYSRGLGHTDHLTLAKSSTSHSGTRASAGKTLPRIVGESHT